MLFRSVTWTMHPTPAFPQTPLDDVFRSSDVISLHLRLSDQTRGFLGPREFALMKPTAILLNTARGAIVNESALIEALSVRRIAGAGLDVFPTEPLPPGHALTAFPNVVLTPHCAGITPEALHAGLRLAVENIWAWAEGRPQHVVVPPRP